MQPSHTDTKFKKTKTSTFLPVLLITHYAVKINVSMQQIHVRQNITCIRVLKLTTSDHLC